MMHLTIEAPALFLILIVVLVAMYLIASLFLLLEKAREKKLNVINYIQYLHNKLKK